MMDRRRQPGRAVLSRLGPGRPLKNSPGLRAATFSLAPAREFFGSLLVAGLVVVLGCRNDHATDDPPTPPPPPATAAASTDAPPGRPSRDLKTASFLGLRAPKPATWIEHPARAMGRVANYTVPGRDGNDAAHIVVSFFGPDGAGPKAANIDRWAQQFRTSDGDPVEPIVKEIEVAEMAVTLVELAGQYRRTGAAWYTADQVLLGVIVEAPVGPVYIRFFGETATVERNRDAFLAMIRGLRAE